MKNRNSKGNTKFDFDGKLKGIQENNKILINNTLIEIPQDGKFLDLLYFNYEKPCKD